MKIFKKKYSIHYLLIIPLFFLVTKKTNAQEMEDNESEEDNINTTQICLSQSCYSVLSGMHRDEPGGNLQNIQFNGPNNIGGRTRALLVDVTNVNHLIAGGVLGGLWVSNDGGQNWKPVNDTAVSLSVTCITQDNFAPQNIYYGGGQVYRDSPPTGAGIFKSTDDGNSFTLLPASTSIAGFQYCNVMKSSLTDSNTLYIGTFAEGLYRTKNGGQSFQQVFPGIDVKSIACFPSGEIMISAYGLGIYVSPTGDSGTYTKVLSGLPTTTDIGNIQIDYCEKVPTVVYAVFANLDRGSKSGLQGVWRSLNHGTSWKKVSNPDDISNFLYPDISLVIACKPNDPSFVLCGGAQLTYSTDSGMTWHEAHISHIDQQTLVFNPDNTNRFYSGNDGGVYNYNINTITSKKMDLNTNYNVAQFSAGAYFPNGMNAIAASWDNYPELFRNGSSSFTEMKRLPFVGGDDNSFFCQVNQQDSNISYTEAPEGIVFRSDSTLSGNPTYYTVTGNLDEDSNGTIDEDALHDNPYEINLLDGQQLYYLTQQRVWRTLDGAKNWVPIMNKIGSAGSPSALGVSFDLSPTVYMGGTNKGIFFRIDSANTAQPGNEANLSSSIPANLQDGYISCITVDPNDRGTVFITYNDNSTEPRLLRVTQATSDTPVWTSVSGDLPPGLGVEWVEVDPQNSDSFFIAATDYGLYSTADAGVHWSKESLPNVKILNIRLRKSDRKLFIFTAGRGMWTADLPSTIITSAGNRDKELKCLIYPNPSTRYINVHIQGIAPVLFQVALIDNLGKKLMQQNYFGTSGVLNINSLAKGVYYLRIQAGDRNISMKKIIKL